MAFLTTVTLLMRPVGALIFGLWAERIGRRIPLMTDVVYCSVVGFLCAFAPNFSKCCVQTRHYTNYSRRNEETPRGY